MSEQGGNPLFDLLAKLDITLGNVSKQSAATERVLRRSEEAKQAESPRYVTAHGQTQLSGTGFGVMRLDLMGPDQGHYWNVRRVVVFGPNTDPTVAVPGRVDLFSSAASGAYLNAANLAAIGLQDWQDFSAALPWTQKYGNGELFLRHNEELLIAITGGTAGALYNAVVRALDVQESSKPQEWSV